MNTFGKILLSFAVLFTFSHVTQAQQKFGNEWIDPAKTYFKIKVAQNGIYKVTYEELTAAGFPQSGIQGTALKLINFGNEQAIFVSDNDFGANDYIEFYGEKNTIGLDSLLFDDWQKDLFNPEYSFVSDTNAYFLTISPETSNLRYTLVNPDYNNITLTPFPYYQHTEKVVYSGSFFKNVDGDIRYSQFEPSEGFGSGLQQASTTSLNASLLVETGPAPVLKFRTGQNNHVSNLEISWNNQLKDTKLTNPRLTTQHTYTLDKSEIKATNTLNLKNIQSTNDRHTIAYVSLKYPRAFDFGNKSEYNFDLPSATGKRLLDITAFKSDNQPVYVFDISNKIRYSTKINSGKVQVIVNPTSAESGYYMIAENDGSRKVSGISVFKPRSYAYTGQQYILISNKSLYETGPNYVKDYADYRSSSIGGNYKTEILEIQDLYDHFGYGIDRHFVSVKNWAGFAKKNWKEAKFAMVLGKAIEYPYMRTSNDVINNVDRVFFVPTFGYPGSDNMLLSEKNFPDPYLAAGRLAAKSADDINIYLDKVKQYDLAQADEQTLEKKYWMKKIMHLGGGKAGYEQNIIKSNLESLKNIIETSAMGGQVFSFYKTSSDPIQIATSEQLNTLINDGVSMITFFGHSGTGTFDFAIENPSKFSNTGKYHIVNSLGCYSGNIHSTGISISEAFLLEEGKGAVAFIASSGTAFISDLNVYSRDLYNIIGNEDLSLSNYGLINQNINQKFRNNSSNSMKNLLQQLTFHGDPAVNIYKRSKPDYILDGSQSKMAENIISTKTDSVTFSTKLMNIGKNTPQKVKVKFEIKLPDHTVYFTRIDSFYVDKSSIDIAVKLPIGGQKAAGLNTLFVVVNPNDEITEGPLPDAKVNNSLKILETEGFEFFVTATDIYPVFPSEYAIVNKNDISLIAVNSNLFASPNTYYFELDSTASFDSPILKTNKIFQSNGGVISWNPTYNFIPNVVYYWRISPEAEANQEKIWRTSSFVYLPDSPSGWNQSHYYQFKDNKYANMEISSTTRKMSFVKNLSSVIITNGSFPTVKPEIKINNDPFEYIKWDNPVLGGVYVSVFNSVTGEYWQNKFPSLYGSTMNSPWASGWGIFPYHTNTTEQRQVLINFIENIIPKGHIVTIFSIQRNDITPKVNYDSDKWDQDKSLIGTSLFEVFEKQGIKNLRSTIENRYPFILAFKKGDSSFAPIEEYALSNEEELRKVINIENFWNAGTVESVPIGPSKKWKNALFTETLKNSTEDTTSVSVLGLTSNFIVDTLISKSTDTNIDLSFIDAEKYPYLKLRFDSKDDKSRTSANISQWKVLFEGYPELTYDPATAFEFYKDTLDQGEVMKFKVAILNASNVRADSVSIDYTINQPGSNSINEIKKYPSIDPCKFVISEFSYNTTPYHGDHSLLSILNKNTNILDQNRSNNLGLKNFYVKKDVNAPILDVTFDGSHILDGDITSSQPNIEIVVNDNNSFIPLNDINLLKIKLFKDRTEINIKPGDLNLIPTQDKNKMKVVFSPLLDDGYYKLEVQACDGSGNSSGVNPYSITFQVINKSSVTSVLNYPNPFSTSTQFVFTLTGREIPHNFSIVIYTMSGKVVKEISKEELGPLKIGTNRTEYKWDGTDAFGEKLANGIYLYKVNISDISNKAFDSLQSKIDPYFNQGFGKMVIIR